MRDKRLETGRQRVLHDDAVYRRIDIQLFDGLKQRLLIRAGRQGHRQTADPNCGTGLRLGTGVDLPAGIRSHRDRRQARLDAPRNQRGNTFCQRQATTFSNGFAINHARGHAAYGGRA